jgi:uncharacterized protein (DUF433 family)
MSVRARLGSGMFMSDAEIIGAFSEEDAVRLTGLSLGQLRSWDRRGLLPASYSDDHPGTPYRRVYSFRDIVSLRVLASLRLDHGVSVQHLRQVSERLAHLGDQKWTATTLYVLGKRVVFNDPESLVRQEIVSGQTVFDIPLKVAIRDTRDAVRHLNARSEAAVGHIVSERYVMNNRPVFEGTRIPVSSVTAYLEHGASTSDILLEFPELRRADIDEARRRMRAAAA